MKFAKDLTTSEIIKELHDLDKKWDDMASDDEFEGRGGSPFEWMDERMQELQYELKKRHAYKES